MRSRGEGRHVLQPLGQSTDADNKYRTPTHGLTRPRALAEPQKKRRPRRTAPQGIAPPLYSASSSVTISAGSSWVATAPVTSWATATGMTAAARSAAWSAVKPVPTNATNAAATSAAVAVGETDGMTATGETVSNAGVSTGGVASTGRAEDGRDALGVDLADARAGGPAPLVPADAEADTSAGAAAGTTASPERRRERLLAIARPPLFAAKAMPSDRRRLFADSGDPPRHPPSPPRPSRATSPPRGGICGQSSCSRRASLRCPDLRAARRASRNIEGRTAAPPAASSSTSTVEAWPSAAASLNAVTRAALPSTPLAAAVACTLAPASSSHRTAAVLPSAAESMSGVLPPVTSPAPPSAGTFAASNTRSTASELCSAATCRAVWVERWAPVGGSRWQGTAWPVATSNLAMGPCPTSDANMSGVHPSDRRLPGAAPASKSFRTTQI